MIMNWHEAISITRVYATELKDVEKILKAAESKPHLYPDEALEYLRDEAATAKSLIKQANERLQKG